MSLILTVNEIMNKVWIVAVHSFILYRGHYQRSLSELFLKFAFYIAKAICTIIIILNTILSNNILVTYLYCIHPEYQIWVTLKYFLEKSAIASYALFFDYCTSYSVFLLSKIIYGMHKTTLNVFP